MQLCDMSVFLWMSYKLSHEVARWMDWRCVQLFVDVSLLWVWIPYASTHEEHGWIRGVYIPRLSQTIRLCATESP